MPKFSVVIPTYNRSAALLNTVNSVLSQNLTDFEIIVVDDGSTDDTEEVIRQFGDDRIRYFWIPNSGGPAHPRNRGIEEARSEWICFLDSDDTWFPSKLSEVDAVVSQSEVDAVYHSLLCRDRAKKTTSIRGTRGVTPDFYKTLLLHENRCPTSSMVARRSFLLKHELRFDETPEFCVVEDYDFWLRMAHHGARFSYIDKVLGEYLIDGSNISGDQERMRSHLLHVLEYHVFRVQSFEKDKEALWRDIQAKQYAYNAISDLLRGEMVPFLKYSMKSVSLSPKYMYQRLLFGFKNKLGLNVSVKSYE